MLSVRAARLAPRTLHACPRKPLQSRRTFITSAVQTLSDGFLDLAIALPFPPSLPAYSSTIILVTIITRLVFTVPFSIWSLRRRWRAEEIVLPILQRIQPSTAEAVLKTMQKAGLRGTKEELNAIHANSVRSLLKSQRDALFRDYHCNPMITMLIPPLSQAPLFMGMTLMFSAAAQGVTPLDSESFLTLTSLTHADPTATLPIALGIITLANVETSRWFMTEAQAEQEKAMDRKNAQSRAAGKLVIQPRKIIQSGLRILSVGRIIIGALVPGSVVIYWVTSATFGLVQTWVFDYLHAVRKQQVASLQGPTLPPVPPIPSPTSRTQSRTHTINSRIFSRPKDS